MRTRLSDDDVAFLRRQAWFLEQKWYNLCVLFLLLSPACVFLLEFWMYMGGYRTLTDVAWITAPILAGTIACFTMLWEKRALMIRIGRLGGLDRPISSELLEGPERSLSFSFRGAMIRLGAFILLMVIAIFFLQDRLAKLALCIVFFILGLSEVARMTQWRMCVRIIKQLDAQEK